MSSLEFYRLEGVGISGGLAENYWEEGQEDEDRIL